MRRPFASAERMRARAFAAMGLAAVLAGGGCQKGPKTPEEAFRLLERDVAAGDALAFYGLLDTPTREAVESTWRDQRNTRAVIAGKYPEAEAQKQLRRLAAADEPDAAHYFAKANGERHEVENLRRRLGSVSGKVMTKIVRDDDVYVARQDGEPFHFHRNGNGSWGFSELLPAWSMERDKASHDLQTARDNAALYEKAESK